jgi:RNA polymerase sigma factor (sigma-70 family)
MSGRTSVVTRVARALGNEDPTVLSDRELLGRFAARGDQAAFAAVVARHASMVLAVCRRALPGPHDPEAACQAVFLLLAEKAGRVRWRSSAAGWLYVAARRVARNARVADARRARREARAAVPEAVAPADPLSGRELVAALDAELDRLPPRYREPLVLCYLEGLPQDEAAAGLGVPLETLKSQLKRGRQKLAAGLAARGYDLGVVLLAVAAAAEARAVSPAVRQSILTAVSRSSVVLDSARKGTLGAMKVLAVGIAAAAVVTLGLDFGSAPPTAAQPPKGDPVPGGEAIKPLIGGAEGRFRAAQPIDDARYAAGDKRIVGLAGTTLYVWAADGSRVRTIDTGLARLPDPTRHDETTLAFAVHPTKSLVACGGVKDGQTRLQVWDFEAGKAVADVASPYDALKVLAWTPDGTRLLERANVGWTKPTGWKLVVRDEQLKEIRAHNLPNNFGEWSTVMRPLLDNRQVVLWQQSRDPLIVDLDTGEAVRTLDFRTSVPSDVSASSDGKTLVLTSTQDIGLLDLTSKETRNLPVLRDGWPKPRPLFSPDGRTVYVWDHRPIAYDVATGREKWKAAFRTVHTVRVSLCDVSRDGKTLLARHGNTLAPLDAATGTEQSPAAAPSSPPGLLWSPDGKTLFTRAGRHDRTWTAWDAATGSRKFDLLPTGFAADDNWKMLPDLFFLPNGREAVLGLEGTESTERVGPKEFLVFDLGTGKCVRRFGHPLPNTDETKWMHPVGLDPTGTSITMQTYAVSGPAVVPAGPVQVANASFVFPTVRWDPFKKTLLASWSVAGRRTEPPRHFAPYCVTVDKDFPSPGAKTLRSATLRCYSAADGRLLHELPTAFPSADPDRVQNHLLLSLGYESKWVKLGANSMRYEPQAPFAYDLWDVPTRGRVRVLELDARGKVVLGPGGEYLLRTQGDRTVAVHEPFVLKGAVTTVPVPGQPVSIEFSPDGERVAMSFPDASVVVWETQPWRLAINAALARAVPTDLTLLWANLGKDPATGLRAARLLGAVGDRGVKFLSEKVARKVAPDAARVRAWIAELDAPRFAAREAADRELRALGGSVETFVCEALAGRPTAEAKERLTKILTAIEAREPSAEEIRDLRAVRAVRWADTTAARNQLAEWAKGDPDASLTKAAAGR